MKFLISAIVALNLLAWPIDGDVHAEDPIVPMTPSQMALKLEPSIGQLKRNNKFTCTTWKMGTKTWATAKHCVKAISSIYTIVTDEGTIQVKSVLTSMEKNPYPKDYWEDWAVLYVEREFEDIPALNIGCLDVVTMGMPIGYLGYPGELSQKDPIKHFATGYVSSVGKSLVKGAYHFMGAFESGPGASGSPIISAETGNVIGFLTRGIWNNQNNLMGVGSESVVAMDYCTPYLENEDDDDVESLLYEDFPAVTLPRSGER